jgi:hypothetical protein
MSIAIDPVVQLGVRLSLTLLFLGTAVHKLRTFRITSEITSQYLASLGRPLSLAVVHPLAAGLVVTELAAAGLCAAYPSGLAAAGLVGTLLTVYAVGMAASLLRGNAPENCGCSWAGTRPDGHWFGGISCS